MCNWIYSCDCDDCRYKRKTYYGMPEKLWDFLAPKNSTMEKRKSEDSVPLKFPDLLTRLSQKYKSED